MQQGLAMNLSLYMLGESSEILASFGLLKSSMQKNVPRKKIIYVQEKEVYLHHEVLE